MQPVDIELIVGIFATAMGSIATILGMSSRKSRAFSLATESFALAETLRMQTNDEEDEAQRVAVQLHRELLARGYEACQDFLSRTAPKRMNLVELVAVLLIWIALSFSFWIVDNSTVPWMVLRWTSAGIGVLLIGLLWSTNKKIDIEEALALKRTVPGQGADSPEGQDVTA